MLIQNIENIRDQVSQLGSLINAPLSLLSIPDSPLGNGTPHIEIFNDEYHYVTSERGYEFSRKKTDDLDELMYWIFESIISNMAVKYELENRIEKQDHRRLIFEKKIELFAKINNDWKEKARKKINDTLKHSPFNDDKKN